MKSYTILDRTLAGIRIWSSVLHTIFTHSSTYSAKRVKETSEREREREKNNEILEKSSVWQPVDWYQDPISMIR